MIATGVVTIILLLIYIGQVAMGLTGDAAEIQNLEATPDCSRVDKICTVLAAATHCTHCLGFVFLLGWYVYGLYIVGAEWANDTSECDTVLSDFIFVLVLIFVGMFVFACFCWICSTVWHSKIYRDTITAAPSSESYDDLCNELSDFDENEYYAFEDTI